MSLARSLRKAIQRSLDGLKEETARAMRMDINAPQNAAEGVMPLWAVRSRRDLGSFALGSDKDIGGLSTCLLDVDESDRGGGSSSSSAEGRGRFYGTVSTDLPRNSRIERSGYAAFRNKTRPTLFGQQTWDTTSHPLLALRVRNRLAKPVSSTASEPADDVEDEGSAAAPIASGSPALRQALHATSLGRPPVEARAIHALGIGLAEPMGPKFFINIQTDGPVTSDLFQHRLYFDERLGDQWQTVVVPLDDFCLTNTGQVSLSQLGMMREKIRTIGISVVLEGPTLALSPAQRQKEAAPVALRKRPGQKDDDGDDWAQDGGLAGEAETQGQAQRGSRRGHTFNFDIGIDQVVAAQSLEDIERVF